MGSAVPTVKAAMVTTLTTAMPAGVQVCWGVPDYDSDDIVAVQSASVVSTAGPMGGLRQRDERITLLLTVSCYRGGTDQQTVTERAYSLLALLEAALTIDPTLAGTARTVEVAGHDMVEAPSEDDQGSILGRVCEINVRVQIQTRI